MSLTQYIHKCDAMLFEDALNGPSLLCYIFFPFFNFRSNMKILKKLRTSDNYNVKMPLQRKFSKHCRIGQINITNRMANNDWQKFSCFLSCIYIWSTTSKHLQNLEITSVKRKEHGLKADSIYFSKLKACHHRC